MEEQDISSWGLHLLLTTVRNWGFGGQPEAISSKVHCSISRSKDEGDEPIIHCHTDHVKPLLSEEHMFGRFCYDSERIDR